MLQPAGAVSIDQSMPLPPGSGSLTVTPSAVPVPGAFEFATVIMKPIGCVVLTGVASAVFTIDNAGHCTVNDALAVTSAWLVASAVAVLLYVLQLWSVVALTTCTDAEP